MAKVAIILINYQNYANKYLKDCLASLEKQSWRGSSQLFIVDNQSSDSSYSYLKKHATQAIIIRNKHNDGFAKGNNDAITQAIEQSYDYVFVLNMDTVVANDCIAELVKVVDSDKKIGAVQARLMLAQDKNKINSLGNITHFLGFGYSLGYKDEILDKNLSQTNIAYPSGAAVLFKANILQRVGLFDEEFWMYNEDQDLGWRIWLAGFKCVLAPEAVVYHKYEFSKSIKKYYWMDRNRIIAILKNYHLLTLLLILPAFIVMEVGLILFSLKNGWFKEKVKVWLYFISPRTWLYLFYARRNVQRLRKTSDSKIIKLFSGKIWYQEIDDIKLRLINPIFNLYWQIVKFIVVW